MRTLATFFFFFTWISLSLGPTAFAVESFHSVSEKELVVALKKYQSMAELQTRFKQIKTLKDMDLKLVSEGTLNLQPPGRVVYNILKPAPVKVTMTPEQIRIENGSGSGTKVQILKTSDVPAGKERAGLKAMVTWLKLDAHELAHNYEISASDQHHFRFLPREPAASPFKSLDMTLDSMGELKNLIMSEASGDTIEFQFEKPVIRYLKSAK